MKGKGRFIPLAAGALTGAANGLFGGGGGMIAVPFLQRAGYPALRAHATAIAVVAPASLVSGAVYAFFGSVPIALLLPVALGGLLGGAVGAKLLRRASPRAVGLLFAAFMLLAGGRMLF